MPLTRCKFEYVFHWRRMGRKGQRLRVVCRGAMNSALVEFEDGYRAVISRNALRISEPRRQATAPPRSARSTGR